MLVQLGVAGKFRQASGFVQRLDLSAFWLAELSFIQLNGLLVIGSPALSRASSQYDLLGLSRLERIECICFCRAIDDIRRFAVDSNSHG